MLKRIIKLIGEGFCNENEIAQQLGMEPSAVEGALEELCMKGYLKLEGGCPGRGDSCASCPSMVEEDNLGKVYLLTEKGKKLLT